MEIAVVKRFLDFFQDFITLCQQENWPNNDTTQAEIKNSLLISKHIEICLDRFQKRGLLDDFLSILNNKCDENTFFNTCIADPPKYILKKIIQSETNIELMDIGFKLFVEIFSEEKLEIYLTDLFVEAASKETLLNNLSKEIPKEAVLKFKSEIILSELMSCTDPTNYLQDLLSDCKESDLELIVICLSNNNLKYMKAVDKISEKVIDVMLKKNSDCKNFWHYIFNVEEKYLIEMCMKNDSLFVYMCKALLDCGKLMEEQMSTEYFYIDLNHSELCRIVGMFFKYDKLRIQFLDVVKEANGNLEFWISIV